MNNSIFFILTLLAGISCSEPEVRDDVSNIYDYISEQKHFYYNVEYNINTKDENSSLSLYGMVSLNRNSDSGISSGYFGLTNNQLPNFIHSIYLKNDWIYNLSSNIFELKDADLITDSLHSPILLNPELLFKIEADSVQITRTKISKRDIQFTFDLKRKPDQLILVWNEKAKRITELEYKYNINSGNAYSRKWSYDYLSKTEYSMLESEYKHQNQISHQPFL